LFDTIIVLGATSYR